MLCRFYLVADREANCFALSVYALRDGAIREGNTVTLLEPFFHNVCVSWQNKVKILLLMQSFLFSPLKIAHVEMLQLHKISVLHIVSSPHI
jgi:hypothetical protein